MLTGIDVSHYDPDLDYAQAHAEGAAFIVHKASEGRSTDPTYGRRAPAIRASGAVPGAYHFLRSSPSAAEQVDHFLSVIGDPAGLLIQLDWEISGSDLAPISVARAWVAEWRRRTGDHPVLIYLPRWVWADHLGSPPGLATLGQLWASRYLAEPPATVSLADAARVPAAWWAGYGGWSRPAVLQFAGEAGRIAGAATADLNLFDGTLADLAALARIPFLEEEDVPQQLAGEVKSGFGSTNATVIVIPPVEGGTAQWGPAWLSLGSDFGDARVRVAVHNGHTWAVWQDEKAAEVKAAGDRWVLALPAGAGKVSLMREPRSDGDTADAVPLAWCVEYAAR
jgi:hypothetical protein